MSIVLLFMSVLSLAQNRCALLIGIGQYPEESGWKTIHGDNDISIIRSFLLENGFEEGRIETLVNSEATKEGITAALGRLMKNAVKDDVIYIQFSGHGQQVTDLNGDEKDGYDESWVTYDAKKYFSEGDYEGQNHLIDDELNTYLNGLRSKVGPKGKIVVIADACHSGSGSRGVSDEEDYIRGTGDVFVIPKKASNIIRKDAPVHWLFVGACKPYQTNHEIKTDDGKYFGSLSYVIAASSESMEDSSYSDVIKVWQTAINEITHYPQTLDDEGKPSSRSRQLF